MPYRATSGLIARLSTASTRQLPALPRLDGTEAELSQWVKARWSDPRFAEAVAFASPDLAAAVAQVEAGNATGRDLRRAALSLSRYLLRHHTRATPFGTWAACIPAILGSTIRLDLPESPTIIHHRKPSERAARARISADAASPIFPGMSVCRNPLALERPTYLELPWAPSPTQDGQPRAVIVQRTAALSALWHAAHAPITVAELTQAITEEHPKLKAEACFKVIAQLVNHGLLLCDVVPSTTALPAPTASPGAHTIANATYPAELTVPVPVAALARDAVEVLLRLSPFPNGDPAWRSYHRAFLERHSTGVAIPLGRLLDTAGDLGPPPGYRGSNLPNPPRLTSERDRSLIALAQQTIMAGQNVLHLTEQVIADLQAGEPSPPPCAEVTLAVAAPDLDTVERGEAVVSVQAASPSLFHTGGRHLTYLDPAATEAAKMTLGQLQAAHPGWRWAQTSPVPLADDIRDLAAHPRLLETRIPIGEHPSGTHDLALDRIGITADNDRMWAVDLDTGHPLRALTCNAIESIRYQHPATRFLTELTFAFDTALDSWSWGAASALPVLPRVQFGQIILAPGRWRLDPALIDPAQDFADWDRGFADLRERYRIPRYVAAGDNDVRYSVDLDQIEHRQLLHIEQARTGTVRLREGHDPASAAWIGGRAHEITLPLLATGAQPAPASSTLPVAPPQAEPPGAGRWWSLRLDTDPAGAERLITHHLSEVASLLGTADLWYLHFRDPAPHVRLRLPVRGPGDLKAIGTWTTGLLDAGQINDCRLDTYRPETGRFGTGRLLEALEQVFAADAACARTILTDTDPNTVERDAATAASLLNLTESVTGTPADAWNWLIAHVPRTAPDTDTDKRTAHERVRETLKIARFLHAAPTAMGMPWPRRRTALATYLHQHATSSTAPDLDKVIADLLHLHCNRLLGVDAEWRLLHLARSLALGLRNQQGTTV